MIDVGKYNKILELGLLLDHYSLLCCIRDGGELPKSKRVQGFINLLCKKGYIADGALTDMAVALIDDCLAIVECSKSIVIPDVKAEDAPFDYAGWIISLHRKIQDKISTKVGKKQVRPKIEGVTYSFLPNSTDLGKVLLKAITTYKLRDFDKIEKCLLKYVHSRIKENNWFPLLGYYIMKNGLSPMVTDLDNDDEETNEDTSINI